MDEAKTLAERSVATRLRLLGDNDPAVAESLNTQGTVHALGGEYETAVSTFERAMAIHESRPAPERATEEYGTLCVNLAGTYQRLGKYASGRSHLREGPRRVARQAGRQPSRLRGESARRTRALKVDLGRYVGCRAPV